mgnify:CR=1 FL=1
MTEIIRHFFYFFLTFLLTYFYFCYSILLEGSGINGKEIAQTIKDEMRKEVEELKKEKANWVWFLAWHTEYLVDNNTTENLKGIYNDYYVITLDELPNLKNS